MKKLIVSLTFVTIVSSALSGCVGFESYVGKQLNPEARGIATVRATPYGCHVLGEAEGKDSVDQFTQGYNKEKLRDSALNDLRNQAAEIVGRSNKRITLRIIEEGITCGGECSKDYPHLTMTGYKVVGQIFECGEKESPKPESENKSKKG
ncbi:DUF4156 domain-containing protein [Aggregatibacter actinomycetemcomitans]|uniref:DUF4156 domain-containing protein n=1 Tax=Aggregatibacter actinomycetemcomitans TaxID=714 RepID=UPI00197BB66E|nr:DUF4156 domain-containing protein [Aggregatibacter actinomycetemcomitans]MBN6073822.1 DUF4156 domain-containing protein [Aggregatibacter actinomycetemcomitans]